MILYIAKDGTEYSYKNGWILKNSSRICLLLDSFILKMLSHLRLLCRLLRLEPRCATLLDTNTLLVSFRHKVYVILLKEKKFKSILGARSGFSHPLSFCSLKTYGVNEVFYGDYGANTDEDEVYIYKYTNSNELTIVYKFPSHTIKHVHRILYDETRNRFYIFTGDFGPKVGIYVADALFSKVEPLLVGLEKYRAVQALALKNGLLWATDAVMADNYLYYYDYCRNKIEQIAELNGSVIYGTLVNGGLAFSTTVESYPSSSSVLFTLLDDRIGPGIKSRDVHVYYIFDNKKIKKLMSFRKDIFPMRLFQYGCVIFPEYEDNKCHRVEISMQAVGVKKKDGKRLNCCLE